MKDKLLGLLPGMRWIPSDLPSQDGATSKKPHHRLFSIKSAKAKSKSKDGFEETPHGSIRVRKSTISLTSQPDAEIVARTHGQGQSNFFAKLPFEIRSIVYDYVMSEATLHLTIGAKKRFGHFICDNEELDKRECGCRVLVGGRESTRVDGGCMALARSCRRMYVSPNVSFDTS
jgi:hypothetical protein